MVVIALSLVMLQAAPPRNADLAELVRKVDPRRIERTVRDLVACGTRHTFSDATSKERGIGRARDYLQKRLEAAAKRSNGRMKVTRETHKAGRRARTAVEVVNIVATITGTVEPDRIYVVSGHYDSRNTRGRDAEGDAPGANDDGSGTAAAVEIAEILADVPLRATLRVVCYDGEEIGLMGSSADVRSLEAKSAAVDGMLTMDIVGNTEAQDGRRERGYVRVFSYQDSAGDSTGRNLARVATDCARRYLGGFKAKLILRGDRYGRGGDHRPFAAAGWPAMRFTEPYENFSRQHKDVTTKDGKPYGDLPDYMDFAYLGQVTRLALCVVHDLANAPPVPVRLRVRGSRNLDTQVILQPGPIPDYVAGYELVWRESTAADWEHVRFVDKSRVERGRLVMMLEHVLLDDSIVGVRSVAKEGSRSRVRSAPEPGVRRRR